MSDNLKRIALLLLCVAAVACEVVIAVLPTLAGCLLAYAFARMFCGR